MYSLESIQWLFDLGVSLSINQTLLGGLICHKKWYEIELLEDLSPRWAGITIQQRPPAPILASSSNLSCSEEAWEDLLLTLNWDGSYNTISSALTEVRKAGLKLSNAFPLYGLINPDSTVWTEGHRLNKQHSLAENMNPVFIKTSFSMLLGEM